MWRFYTAKEDRADPVFANRRPFALGHPVAIVVLIDQVAVARNADVMLPVEPVPAHGGRPNHIAGVPVKEAGRENGVAVHVQGTGVPLLMPVTKSLFTQGLGFLPFLA